MSKHLTKLLLLCLASITCAGATQAQVRVVASIKPLQMIAHAITQGVSEPALLIPSSQSYHHFTLRPSTIRLLNSAELLIWVGPELETYLSDALSSASVPAIEVLALPGLQTHYAGDDHEHVTILIPESGNHAGHQHSSSGMIDPHVWLDTRNAGLIASALAARLIAMDPAAAAVYAANLQDFLAALELLQSRLARELAPVAAMEYAVYHNAFQYFEKQFGLHHDVVFVESEELEPGVRHMLAIRHAVQTMPLKCLLEDVTTRASTVQSMLGSNPVRRVRADTTGQTLESGPDAYRQLISNLADAFRQCLAD
jgi:zinc transport system substrate-binding protein